MARQMLPQPLIGDLIGLLKQVFVVAYDWGAIIAWDLCLLRPDRVRAYVAVSVPFRPRLAGGSGLKEAIPVFGEGFYLNWFQEPGKAEREYASVGTKTVLKSVIPSIKLRENLIAPEEIEPSSALPVDKNLPPWFTEEDLQYYTENYEKSGFSGPLNYYRNADRNWELKAPWSNSQTKTLFIAGNEDVVLQFPGVKEDMEGPGFKNFVPNLKDIVLLDGGHFIHEEQFAKFNEVLLTFLQQQLSDI